MTSPLRTIGRAALAALLAAPAILGAQSRGTIRGVVSRSESRDPIAGARVGIENSTVVATDDRGRYVLRDLPAGRHVVVFTALGRTAVRDTVSVTAGSIATHDVSLREGSLMLSSVIVSATRTETDAGKVASTVNVLTPEQIRTTPARETQDMLREIPAIELPRTSSLVGGSAQIVSIRGVDEGRTAVLFDGIPVNDAWGEWIDWGRVPKNMLDRVEVVEGGTSNLYGNGAMGGVISFFSRPMAPGAARIMVEGGSRDMRHAYGSAGVPVVGALTANVDLDYQEGGGYTLLDPLKRGAVDTKSDVISRNAYVRLNWAPASSWSGFLVGHRFGDSRETGTTLSRTARDQGNVDLGIDNHDVLGGGLQFRGWTGRMDEHQRSTTIRTNRVAEDSSVIADIPSHDWGGSAVWTREALPMRLESFSIGADYRHYSGNFAEVDFNTTCPGANCGTVTRTISSGGDQALSGAFAQLIAAPVAKLRAELGVRIDGWQNTNAKSTDAATGTRSYADVSKTAFSPRLGLRYELLSSLSLHGAVYKSFRAPNLAELYRKQISATQITIPNPDLKPETANGREVGIDWQPASFLQLKGTVYRADYVDFNVPVTVTGADKPADCGAIATCRTRLNVSKAKSEGGEAYVAIRPIAALQLSGSVSFDDARVVAGPAGTVVGAHFNRIPSPRQTVRASYSSAMLGDYTVMWRHEGHTTTLGGLWLDPFNVVDAHVARELVQGVRGFVAVENIGDTQYQVNVAGTGAAAIYSFGLPRTVRVGVEAFRF
ncbi:MAG: TonB-dependent receptor [Gemmatimonadetes bacterium]|nr:TonB-dependent receptor [Gemmatimonadota bacterium]